MVYLPKIKKDINKKIYKKKDFEDGGIAAQKGDDAIKLLYVPPFALAVSIIALLLNIITVFSMWLLLTHIIPKKGIFVAKTMLIVFLGIAPLISQQEAFGNKLLEKVNVSEVGAYLKFLTWISFYEKLNAKIHKQDIYNKLMDKI